MHKSLGNAIEPEEVINNHGADLLRLWTASVDFTEDVRISETILTRLSEAYRKLRNTFRYALGNLTISIPRRRRAGGRNARDRPVDSATKCAPRNWWRAAAPGTTKFAFHKVYRAVYDFATVDLSAVYFDVLKDRLYTAATKSRARRSAQTALYRLAHALVRLLAPDR
jgi:isoleucyl-tRNA synthetase